MSSAARLLSVEDVTQLGAIAEVLPATWVVAVEAPHGQVAILPRSSVRAQVATWVVDGAARKAYRQRWHPVEKATGQLRQRVAP